MKDMIGKWKENKPVLFVGLGSLALFSVALCSWVVIDKNRGTTSSVVGQPMPERIPIRQTPVIDYNRIDKNAELRDLMKSRKSQYGMNSGVDMIAKADETVKVGNSVVPMKDIVHKIRLNQLQVVSGNPLPPPEVHPGDDYGIYVVRPGDSIWKIHYRLLQGFFEQKGVSLPWWSDEPMRNGKSSGIARILKYSESMVSIYNVKENRVETNLNHLEPDSKIAVFNIAQTLERLQQIDYQQINRVRFDGKKLLIPGER